MEKRKTGLLFVGSAITFSAVAASWAGMIYGWGLTPASWPWIIGSAIGSMILIGVGQYVNGCASNGSR